MSDTDSTKNDFTPAQLKDIPQLNLKSYAQLVEHLAKEIEAGTGIDYRVPIAHSANESRQGNSALCRDYANLFGITATPNWKANMGKICAYQTKEFIREKWIVETREFRAYASWKDSFADWAKLISNLGVYHGAYQLLKNKETVKDGIRMYMRIWATDPKGSETVLKIYEELCL